MTVKELILPVVKENDITDNVSVLETRVVDAKVQDIVDAIKPYLKIPSNNEQQFIIGIEGIMSFFGCKKTAAYTIAKMIDPAAIKVSKKIAIYETQTALSILRQNQKKPGGRRK